MPTQRLTIRTLIVLAATFFFFPIISSSLAAIYYVDVTRGNDSSNGTSTSTPWKTIAKVNLNSFRPSDSILFKRGETWREMLNFSSSGSAGSVITFGAYGSGNNPIISGSDLITAGWTKESTSIWKAIVTAKPNIVYFNGTPGTLVAEKANITSEFKWFWTSNVLYVWSPTSSDPSAYYTKPGIEAGARDQAIRTNDKSYVTVDGITARDGNQINGAIVNVGSVSVTGIVFQNCVIERGLESGIVLKGSTTAISVTVDHCTIRNNGGWGIVFHNTYAIATISNNAITGNGWASAANSQQYAGIQGRLGNANIFGNTIHSNVVGAASAPTQSHGIYASGLTAAVNIHDNVIYNHPNGNGIKLIGSANVYRNILYGNSGSGIEAGQNGSTNVVYVISYNIAYNNNTSDMSSGITEQTKGTGTISITVENNTLYQNGTTAQQELKIADAVTALTVKNNIFYATSSRPTMWLVAQTGIVSIDYNLHWRADGAPRIYYDDAEKQWAQWKLLGFDTHGVNADPKFTDANAAMFTLQSCSPAIGAGVSVGLSVDLAGRQVPGGAPDIGAHEWWSTLPSPPQNLRIVPN